MLDVAQSESASRDFNLARGPKQWGSGRDYRTVFFSLLQDRAADGVEFRNVEPDVRLTTKAHRVKSHHV
jgi:hypothetical protein